MTIMMKCGHAANARDDKDEPVCVICIGIHPRPEIVDDAAPDLAGREALDQMASVKPGDQVRFLGKKGPQKGRFLDGEVEKVWSKGPFVGVNIRDRAGLVHVGVSLHDIEATLRGHRNPMH